VFNLSCHKGKIICIYGPTAAYKSKFAISLAKDIGGVIINADSQQIYSQIPILTSQPSKKELNLVAHKLYGIINPNKKFSVYQWLEIVVKKINSSIAQGLTPILVGGTGLYFSCLINGIAAIPKITKKTNEKVLSLTKKMSNFELHELLSNYDEKLSERLSINDRVRILRGLEVFFETGISILEWQKNNKLFFTEGDFFNIYICPNREVLYKNINTRFLRMLDCGVVNEVKTLIKTYKIDELPKIIGLSTIHQYDLNQIPYDEMILKVQKLTRNYAKRQYTWFNNKIKHDSVIKDYN
jgi:tRNA dimethylallyltransferase